METKFDDVKPIPDGTVVIGVGGEWEKPKAISDRIVWQEAIYTFDAALVLPQIVQPHWAQRAKSEKTIQL